MARLARAPLRQSFSAKLERIMAGLKTKPRSWWKLFLLLLLVLAGAAGIVGWYKLFREEPQPAWVTSTPDMRFKYGSIGAEHDAGIPYWIWYVLPRVFSDKLPRPTGYASLGVLWEPEQELPVGFTKKVIGFPRIANNCASCHAASYRKAPDAPPTIVPAGPNHTLDLQAFFRFVVDCAKDPRFNADDLLAEIDSHTDLPLLDRLMYRYLLIPITRKRLLEREEQFKWVYRADFPLWGRGRDDAMNLTKYFMLRVPMDNSIGPTDMPSVWNLKKYKPEQGMLMNLAGDSHDARSVIIDSALGLLGAAPHDRDDFLEQAAWLEKYLSELPAPKYPFPVNDGLATSGKEVFDRNCASCHASERTGTRIPVDEVGTDRERLGTWSKQAAIESNKVVRGFGIERKGLVEIEPSGYIAAFLDGIWLRAPYLHNGSVPTLRDLLKPVGERPKVFYRGYDVYDPENVGFVSQGAEAEKVGTKFDVSERASGNQGHEFGTMLSTDEKNALIEYLKTL
jgi:mono/diheme cytochrome c family protein